MDVAPLTTAAERADTAKALRDRVPRSSHSGWSPSSERRDPVAVLAAAERSRSPELVPIRNARMAASAFAFFRGAAALMAADLSASTPATGLTVQCSGDAHCLNFGAFPGPDGRWAFELNDFDETLPGPWEWDVKRLAVSLVLAARGNKLKAGDGKIAALTATRAYRLQLAACAEMSALAVWHARIDMDDVTAQSATGDRRRGVRGRQTAVEKLTEPTPHGRRFRDEPPLLYHSNGSGPPFDVDEVLRRYAESLAPEVGVLVGRYRTVDRALNVVGIGSVGTRCGVALLEAEPGDAVVLQIKEASSSALAAYCAPSVFATHGERIVHGQRLMQPASDALLGWASSGGRDFFVRRYKETKGTPDLAVLDGEVLRDYGECCGRALAIGHARSGDAASIAGYLGRSDVFDKAIVRFAQLYADQTEMDFDDFIKAIRANAVAIAR